MRILVLSHACNVEQVGHCVCTIKVQGSWLADCHLHRYELLTSARTTSKSTSTLICTVLTEASIVASQQLLREGILLPLWSTCNSGRWFSFLNHVPVLKKRQILSRVIFFCFEIKISFFVQFKTNGNKCIKIVLFHCEIYKLLRSGFALFL